MDSQLNISNFEKSLGELLKVSKDIMVAHEKLNLKFSSKKNPILARLENYIKTFEQTDDYSDHTWPFQKIYRDNKTAILRGPARDSWLSSTTKTGIIVNFGEQFDLKNDIKIHLSAIYANACKNRDQIEESLQGLPDIEQAEELLYVPKFMLRLYEIFVEVCGSKEEKEKLSDYIDILSREAKVKRNVKKTATSDDPLSGFMDVASNIMKQVGIQMPEGQKMPSAQELSSKLQTMMARPEVSSKIGNVMKDLQGCNNFGEMIGKVMGNLGNLQESPEGETIKDTLQSTVESAERTAQEGQDGDGSGDEFID